MKRVYALSAFLLAVDQILKFFFQHFFANHTIYLFNHEWGFTYVVNAGTWLNPNITKTNLFIVQLVALGIWIVMFRYLKEYYIKYRRSILIDLSFAFFTTGILGNTLDHLMFGYVRDFFINPIAISNFADICGLAAIIFLVVELLHYARSSRNSCNARR